MNQTKQNLNQQPSIARQLSNTLQLLTGYRLRYGAAIAMRLLSNALYTGIALTVGNFVDTLMRLNEDPTVEGKLIQLVLQLFACAVGLSLSVHLSMTLTSGVAEDIERGLRNAFYDRSQRLPMAFHTTTETGDLIQRATSDIDEVRAFFSDHLLGLARVLFQYVTNLWALWMINLTVAWTSLIMGPIILWFALVIFKKMGAAYEEQQERESRISTDVQENLTGIRVVKAFNRESFQYHKFLNLLDEKFKSGNRVILIEMIFWGGTDLLVTIQLLISLMISGVLAIRGTITVGEFIAAQTCVILIVTPIRTMGQLIVRSSRALISLQRVKAILDQPEEPLDDGDSEPTHTPPLGKIEFRDVTFAYPQSEPTLKKVSFTVEPGQTVGILGLTGSGKSTLFNLLLRYFDPASGTIYLDDVDISRISRSYLRREIAIVEQEPFLFGRTIAENIALGMHREVTQEEIESVAKIAAVHDAIMSFEKGYGTKVGERGVTLSGGQKQRIAIARAMLRDPQVILFDDATSAIDADTEAQIRTALNLTTRKKTILTVTHRIQSVISADLILVMKNGALIQKGTHETLSTVPGLYRDMLEIQTRIENELEIEIQNETASN